MSNKQEYCTGMSSAQQNSLVTHFNIISFLKSNLTCSWNLFDRYHNDAHSVQK